jgi:hypothetical protein
MPIQPLLDAATAAASLADIKPPLSSQERSEEHTSELQSPWMLT